MPPWVGSGGSVCTPGLHHAAAFVATCFACPLPPVVEADLSVGGDEGKGETARAQGCGATENNATRQRGTGG